MIAALHGSDLRVLQKETSRSQEGEMTNQERRKEARRAREDGEDPNPDAGKSCTFCGYVILATDQSGSDSQGLFHESCFFDPGPQPRRSRYA